MKSFKKRLYACIAFTVIAANVLAQKSEFCGIKNTAFVAGEKLTMKVIYNAVGAYIGAGEATFTSSLERYNGKPVYHMVGEGKTYPFFDNFFMVSSF